MGALRTVETKEDYIDYMKDVTRLLDAKLDSLSMCEERFQDAKKTFYEAHADKELSGDEWRSIVREQRRIRRESIGELFDELHFVEMYTWMIQAARFDICRLLINSY